MTYVSCPHRKRDWKFFFQQNEGTKENEKGNPLRPSPVVGHSLPEPTGVQVCALVMHNNLLPPKWTEGILTLEHVCISGSEVTGTVHHTANEEVVCCYRFSVRTKFPGGSP